MAGSVLVFPAGMPRSLVFMSRAVADGLRVIGASSLGHDPARIRYPEWVQLPYVTDASFDAALQKAISDLGVDRIFTPNLVVWNYLSGRIAQHFPGLALVNPSPLISEVAPYHDALRFAASLTISPLHLAVDVNTGQPPIEAYELAAVFRHAETIPGMCDHEKIHALCEAFRYMPEGDIVEIGSWWGKSAFVLLRLATCYRIGNLLCVDPWSNEHLIQNDDTGLVDSVAVDADEALIIFKLNLLPYSQGHANYLRMPSTEAARVYNSRETVSTDAFGDTTYEGRIAMLHVDGNHSYACAMSDLVTWADKVVPGGWIVVDDYNWPYGDGPKRAGDWFLDTRKSDIAIAFVMGGALFVRLRS
jgi:hypothetical protein